MASDSGTEILIKLNVNLIIRKPNCIKFWVNDAFSIIKYFYIKLQKVL